MKRISQLEKDYVLDALEGQFRSSVNGKYNRILEEAFAERFNSPFAIGHQNGTATMHTALVAAGLMPGDKVIVPPLTMASTSLCVLQAGMIPVFADVDIETWQISLESIRENYTSDVKAIISVSLYGGCPDYDPILDFAEKHGLVLIEDNAENFLGMYKGGIVGSFGHFASFSFQASKHMTSGEGGMLLIKDEQMALKARQFSSLGYTGIDSKKGKITKKDIQSPLRDRHVALGFNYRMSELQAACALGQLERLDELVDARVKISKQFLEILKGSDLFTEMNYHEGVTPSYWGTSLRLNDHVPLEDWFRLYDLYASHGGSGFYAAWKLTYQEPFWQQKVQSTPGVTQVYREGLCPNAETLQPRIISFPNNQYETKELERDLEALIKVLNNF